MATWAVLLSQLINSAFLGQSRQPVRTSLLKDLKANSKTLMDISRQFVHRAPSLRIMSFIELQPEPPLTKLVRHYVFWL